MFSSSVCMPISPSSHSLLKANHNPLQGLKPSCSPSKIRASYLTTRALLSTTKETVLKDFHERRALKIISGLQNFNKENVASVVTAADKGGATHVDIACDPELVKLAITLTSLPVCVSSVEPRAFLAAVEAGAQMVEIGNYDSFYDQGVVFSPEKILNLTKETQRILPSVTLSVTVPHTLSLPDQVKLAELLEQEGVDIIQTEGGKCSNPSKSGVLGLIEKVMQNNLALFMELFDHRIVVEWERKIGKCGFLKQLNQFPDQANLKEKTKKDREMTHKKITKHWIKEGN